MASLMEDLLTVLESEREIYEQLIPISEKKTEILVKGDLKELEAVTQEEQFLVDKATALGKQRESTIANIGVVLNKDAATLDLGTLANLLGKQPEERAKLVNEKNKNLIENSLEMIEFNMNFIQSTRMSPGVNNYDRNASSSFSPGYTSGSFDAKQ